LSDRNDGNRPTLGAHSLCEILSQPKSWEACLASLRKSEAISEVRNRFGKSQAWLFIGCGSSYYVAQAAAATMTTLTKLEAKAVPASEVLLYPELALPTTRNFAPILISRSGRTSEVLQAGELLRSRNTPTVAVTCAANQPLEKQTDLTLLLPADEQSTVMTRSFTSMLLALQELAGVIGEDSGFGRALGKLAAATDAAPPRLSKAVQEFVNAHNFADYVCLGQGPYFGLACEYALKVTEMSLSYAQAFHTLEFRHGPKSIVGPETLLTFLISESGYEAEAEVLMEMKSLGATTMVITNQADSRVRAAADLLVELSLDLPEFARLVPSVLPGQLLGLHTGLKRGLDPDNPRNLSRVVVLDESKHATL
jgi:glutamine---fructose-6-phosphate transaminase (isomerizing)